jgi:ATP-dependent DNA helicase DinG
MRSPRELLSDKPGIDTGIIPSVTDYFEDEFLGHPPDIDDLYESEKIDPDGDEIGLSSDYIDEVFGQQGLLAQKFAGYEPRPAQIEIVRTIDDAILNGKRLLVEAPCGTGKGLSYLTPAIRHALESGASRVLVVTANIALSEQLIKKDLPTLRAVLPWPFEFAMAKGRANFACKYQHDGLDRPLLRMLPTNREQVDYIDKWIKETATGDL